MDITFSSLFFLIAGFLGMEIFSWFIHKYIMHGLLWKIHRTHHSKTHGFFELNDVFSLFFGSVAIILIILGFGGLDYRFWLGCGITFYGLSYFVLHDIFIHRRLKVLKKPSGRYLEAISKAHRDHHKSRGRDGSVSFGLLIVPYKYFRKKA